MSNSLFKLIKGIKNLATSHNNYVVGIAENGALTRTKGYELYKVGWTNQHEDLDHTAPNSDTTVVHLQTTYLRDTYERHINQSYAYDDNLSRAIGTINSIGGNANLSSDEWIALDNRRVIITAEDGCWFNIANNGASVPTTQTKVIITKTNNNIEKCIKAVFTYDKDNAYWVVESYELLEDYQRYFFKRYTFGSDGITSPVEYDLPSSAGLPYVGYYAVDVFCRVEELDGGGALVNTLSPHQLEVKSRTSGTYLLIDKSGHFVPPPTAPTAKWVNNSLQGSAIIEVTGSACSDRGIVVKVTLPNTATTKNVSGGYMHIHYLGTQIGNNCS